MTKAVEKDRIAEYWNAHIHDLAVVKNPVGTLGFFDDLDEYRFDKLRYLPRIVDFLSYAGKDLLEVGCGTGIDLARFAAAGAKTTGIDLSRTAIDLAERNFSLRGLSGDFAVMDGEAMSFPDASFDVVYGHGVLQYTHDPNRMVKEMHRVLRPGGTAIFMMYNRVSWLNLLSRVTNVGLEHEDAPVLRRVSIPEFQKILSPFTAVEIVPERFPVKSRLHGGLKGRIYNGVFVGGFNALPRRLVRRFGWHLMGLCVK